MHWEYIYPHSSCYYYSLRSKACPVALGFRATQSQKNLHIGLGRDESTETADGLSDNLMVNDSPSLQPLWLLLPIDGNIVCAVWNTALSQIFTALLHEGADTEAAGFNQRKPQRSCYCCTCVWVCVGGGGYPGQLTVGKTGWEAPS